MSYNELERNFFVQELKFINLCKEGKDKLSACMEAFDADPIKAQDILSRLNMEEITSESYIKKLEKTVELLKEYVSKEETPFRR